MLDFLINFFAANPNYAVGLVLSVGRSIFGWAENAFGDYKPEMGWNFFAAVSPFEWGLLGETVLRTGFYEIVAISAGAPPGVGNAFDLVAGKVLKKPM